MYEVDWGVVSDTFDEIYESVKNKDLSLLSEAQTRFSIIDRIIREVLLWENGQITVEESSIASRQGYVDYTLRVADMTIIVEAKKAGLSFPNPTQKSKLKINGSVLGVGEIKNAIHQAREYALSKSADLVVVTNGQCWCYFQRSKTDNYENSYAYLVFPFENIIDAEKLFRHLCMPAVENGSTELITSLAPFEPEKKLIHEVKDSDARVDRNNIADYIAPALDSAFYSGSLLSNKDQLEKCFITSLGRTKFDSTLGIYLSDTKPDVIKPAKRMKSDSLKVISSMSTSGESKAVTLVIGQVGAGKSTYLKHFEYVSGSDIIAKNRVRWIYIDFEAMGKGVEPRSFIFQELLKYLNMDHKENPIDYKNVIQPAYADEISALARGPYALIYSSDKTEFNRIIQQRIADDFEREEPYVEKVLSYMTKMSTCIIVLDNIDLYEDEILETKVFSEGIAISKRINANIIMSIRDSTFIKHRNDSLFDAYELRKLWLDPPSFRAVLSQRFTYSKKVLEKKSAHIPLENGMFLEVPDLSIFFDIVQRSVLQGETGIFIESIADNNIRKGLSLAINFLSSGHIQADRAIKSYLSGEYNYSFPFHEVFKGSILGQWKLFKEDRAECINIFESKLGYKNIRLLRLYILKYLFLAARSDVDKEVIVGTLIEVFTKLGTSEASIIRCIIDLLKFGLLRCTNSDEITRQSVISITKRGAYYIKYLSCKLVYVEACLYDTVIDDQDTWEFLLSTSNLIDYETYIPARMEKRKVRILKYLEYLSKLESEGISLLACDQQLKTLSIISDKISAEVEKALTQSYRYYSE
ncbi:MAG: hypothetical protein VB070_10630 [Clostridiaceae bacterium]|nr:hypothetical protein [Clostridiaceae bacterium]